MFAKVISWYRFNVSWVFLSCSKWNVISVLSTWFFSFFQILHSRVCLSPLRAYNNASFLPSSTLICIDIFLNSTCSKGRCKREKLKRLITSGTLTLEMLSLSDKEKHWTFFIQTGHWNFLVVKCLFCKCCCSAINLCLTLHLFMFLGANCCKCADSN